MLPWTQFSLLVVRFLVIQARLALIPRLTRSAITGSQATVTYKSAYSRLELVVDKNEAKWLLFVKPDPKEAGTSKIRELSKYLIARILVKGEAVHPGILEAAWQLRLPTARKQQLRIFPLEQQVDPCLGVYLGLRPEILEQADLGLSGLIDMTGLLRILFSFSRGKHRLDHDKQRDIIALFDPSWRSNHEQVSEAPCITLAAWITGSGFLAVAARLSGPTYAVRKLDIILHEKIQ